MAPAVRIREFRGPEHIYIIVFGTPLLCFVIMYRQFFSKNQIFIILTEFGSDFQAVTLTTQVN